jgi:DNA-binding transcriptional ArsR family regulator
MYNSSVSSVEAVFKAIAHPARRKIISLLSESECSVKTLTAAFPMTQPAVSQHLRELRDARLVTSEKVGLEHIYRLTGRPLAVVFDWSNKYRRFFDPTGHAWEFVERRQGKTTQKGSQEKHGR